MSNVTKLGGNIAAHIKYSSSGTKTYVCGFYNAEDKGKQICEMIAGDDPRRTVQLGSGW